jgi:hypothetical protein
MLHDQYSPASLFTIPKYICHPPFHRPILVILWVRVWDGIRHFLQHDVTVRKIHLFRTNTPGKLLWLLQSRACLSISDAMIQFWCQYVSSTFTAFVLYKPRKIFAEQSAMNLVIWDYNVELELGHYEIRLENPVLMRSSKLPQVYNWHCHKFLQAEKKVCN